MDLQSIVINNVTKAFNVLGSMAPEYVLEKVSNTYDPQTSNMVSAVTAIRVRGFQDNDVGSYFGKEPLPAYSVALFVRGVEPAPDVNDKMIVDDVKYTVSKVKHFKAGKINAVHLVLLSK